MIAENDHLDATQDLDESIQPATTPKTNKGRKLLGKVTFGLIGNKEVSDESRGESEDQVHGGSFLGLFGNRREAAQTLL